MGFGLILQTFLKENGVDDLDINRAVKYYQNEPLDNRDDNNYELALSLIEMTNYYKQLQEGFDSQIAQITNDFHSQLQDVKSSNEGIIAELKQSIAKYKDTIHDIESMSQSVNINSGTMNQSVNNSMKTESKRENNEYIKHDSYLFSENENNTHSESRMSNKLDNINKSSLSSKKNIKELDKSNSRLF